MSQEKKLVPNFTQTPNVFFDEWLTELSSSEIHVLCAIIRKTYGWRKEEDKISFSQLKSMTNLALSTIQNAIKKLIERGIIASRIVDGICSYSFVLETPHNEMEKNLPDKKINTIPNSGKGIVQNNSYIPNSGKEVYRNPVTPPIPNSGNTKESLEKKEIKESLSLFIREDGFGCFDSVNFDFDKKIFVMTPEQEKKYYDRYEKKIESLGLKMFEVYQKACKKVVERQNTDKEVKRFGVWLDIFFKDASNGNVYKKGALDEAEQKNFDTNYEFFCSLSHFKGMKVSGKYLFVKNKEYNFYSSPEIFKEAFKDYEF
jgi:phage replication O-like protein O